MDFLHLLYSIFCSACTISRVWLSRLTVVELVSVRKNLVPGVICDLVMQLSKKGKSGYKSGWLTVLLTEPASSCKWKFDFFILSSEVLMFSGIRTAETSKIVITFLP